MMYQGELKKIKRRKKYINWHVLLVPVAAFLFWSLVIIAIAYLLKI